MSMPAGWTADVFKDASVIFVTLTSLFLSFATLGVPLIASAMGVNAPGSWHSVVAALIVLAAAGYLFIEITSDVFDKKSRILQTPAGKRWRPLSLSAVAFVLCGVLLYLKQRNGGGGGYGDMSS
jgi:hypothetical protein